MYGSNDQPSWLYHLPEYFLVHIDRIVGTAIGWIFRQSGVRFPLTGFDLNESMCPDIRDHTPHAHDYYAAINRTQQDQRRYYFVTHMKDARRRYVRSAGEIR